MAPYLSKEATIDTEYELKAVVRHIGTDAQFGHYICDKLQPFDVSDTNQRFSLNGVSDLNEKITNDCADTKNNTRRWKRCDDSVTSDIAEVCSSSYI